MSVILNQELNYGSRFAGDKMILEPVIDLKEPRPFLDSQVLNPELFKKGILQLNHILIAHPGVNLNMYYDPIVTVTENYVDFDGFARFGHTYCKIRFPEKLFDGHIRQEGVTNVDFNPGFIRNLRNRYTTQKLWLCIDAEGVDLAVNKDSYHLKKVAVPKWWNDAYVNLKNYVDIENLEPKVYGKEAEDYTKVILSGQGFQKLVNKVEHSHYSLDKGVRSLLWNNKTVDLVYKTPSKTEVDSSAPIGLITPCDKPVNLWGIWRIQNLSEIAEYIIQADVYMAKKQPSFWLLHARSGVELLLGYTPYTNALWTEKARKEVAYLLEHPYSSSFPSRIPRRRRQYIRRNKQKTRNNFVQNHPGQRIILDFILG